MIQTVAKYLRFSTWLFIYFFTLLWCLNAHYVKVQFIYVKMNVKNIICIAVTLVRRRIKTRQKFKSFWASCRKTLDPGVCADATWLSPPSRYPLLDQAPPSVSDSPLSSLDLNLYKLNMTRFKTSRSLESSWLFYGRVLWVKEHPQNIPRPRYFIENTSVGGFNVCIRSVQVLQRPWSAQEQPQYAA